MTLWYRQVQALERTQPGLPLGIGHTQTKSMITPAMAPSRYSLHWVTSKDPLKKPIFWRETGLERLYLLASIFEEEAFSVVV
ncbi:hypothetical protein ALQ95_00659 [Pseudomonas syringae pv. ribicola]|uniref:Uncharacterized protein n=2 Tax=Pseudomonas syringae group genomosp. 3 TaxID=251701 RepID=A0A3M2VZC4_PSESI|nr:hypothetical protein ALQ95_00659 [Pseudomonas syringae pv. ribicola]